MSFPRIFISGTVCLFAIIGVVGLIKKKSSKTPKLQPKQEQVADISDTNIQEMITREITDNQEEKIEPEVIKTPEVMETAQLPLNVDRVGRLFSLGKSKLPIVETVSYASRVSWLKGRPAWIADYASFYGTSRHFIARSLNGKRDYYTQKVSAGDRFNVFSKDKEVEFYLVVDVSRLNIWFYALDKSSNERILLKNYKIGLGKIDSDSESGSKTPLGKFTLGDKIAIYKPGVEGYFEDNKIEMVQVFGTRWIPMMEETEDERVVPVGIGLHGAPWVHDDVTNEYVEDISFSGNYVSKGCIRLSQKDVEELFSIVITKPTTVEIVKKFEDANLPLSEWSDPLEQNK